jgi:formate C-acetyltransferase
MGGHVIAGYDRVLAEGLSGLAETARTELRRREGGPDGEEREFLRAALVALEAAEEYVLRYALAAEELASRLAAGAQADQLHRIAEACRWVSRSPPRGFFEAVQLLWLVHEILTAEQGSGSLSLGRLDRTLLPYYERDLAAGTLTRAEAAEIVQALWLKLAGLRRGFQNVTLGGRAPDGRYSCNDLTFLCLQATRELRQDQPLLSLRWAPDIPDQLWNEAQALIEEGMGFPALFNDEAAVAAKTGAGISRADAEEYGIVGCVELSVPGREFSHTEGLRVNWAKALELALHGGRCSMTEARVRLHEPRDPAGFATFEEFHGWFQAELAHLVEAGIRGLDLLDSEFPRKLPYPFLSCTMEGCLERGRDVTAGATRYNLSTVNGCGMADTADSLMAIRRAVFQERRTTLPRLVDAMRTWFRGEEELRQELATRTPRYGNDSAEPDGMLADLAAGFAETVRRSRNPRGGGRQVGLYTVDSHAMLGRLTGCLPSGRKGGTPLASGLSPCQGFDRSGPTAVARSATRLPHRLLANGMVLDLKFHPDLFSGDEQRRAFRAFVETYFRLGGMEIQFNVVTGEKLLAAQRNPAEHRDLVVRVSGFSAHFVEMDRDLQDEIIARTTHRAVKGDAARKETPQWRN